MGTAGIEGDADDAFELVGRPLRPGAALAGKPARPGDLEVGCCNSLLLLSAWVFAAAACSFQPQLRASGA